MIFLLVVGAFLGAVHYWLYRRFARAAELPRGGRIAVAAVLSAGWLLAVIGFGSGTYFATSWARPPGYVGMVWLSVVFYLWLGAVLIALLLLAGRLLRFAAARPGDRRRRVFVRATSILTATVAVGASIYGAIVAQHPRATHTVVELPGLPAEFDGTRVAVIADLHVGPALGASFTQKVVDLVTAQEPDMIVLPGDLIDGTVAKVGADIEPLSALDAPLGVYAVSGNHEYYADDVNAWLDYWETLGLTVLRNEHQTVFRDGAALDVAGVHDYDAPEPDPADMAAALEGRNPENAVMLVAHQPLHSSEAAANGVDLQISGHTHGGQMWPFHFAVKLVHDTALVGLDQVGPTTLYTTSGVGAWGPPVRVGAPPEVPILELRSR
ncbi:metallophosphoesterase [Hoyosella sp. YIM 151337]|uniref:metallophosphoesterase n=1 Tax=Hoyosella sp. YIM 151337 TaxID=2992742 RepID=UPI002235B7FD|nr:metallophosphoesterase [Hoyosella sp. YIM 151337]MCW4354494.1 metallophosphoesterase [Hoyosella sp. YIM 151337]